MFPTDSSHGEDPFAGTRRSNAALLAGTPTPSNLGGVPVSPDAGLSLEGMMPLSALNLSGTPTPCTECGLQLAADGTCPAGHGRKSLSQEVPTMALNLSAEEQQSLLDLANFTTDQRKALADKGEAMPDGSYPIRNVADLKNAVRAVGRASNGDAVKAHIKKRAKALGAEEHLPEGWEDAKGEPDADDKKKNLGQDQEHSATVFDEALQLASKSDGGLVWKVLCKTGTLALSPGPGQQDVEKPLVLTPQLFLAVKQAYDDHAFEHVTIPETHTNGTLENTGTVDNLEVLDHASALKDMRLSQEARDLIKKDPADTRYLLGGLNFTEPQVKGKVERGSVINCSVGLKFNYRNKRTGKTYPVALEHLALTNQPWVDGLVPFGQSLTASQPFDQDQEVTWDGVFTTAAESSDSENGRLAENADLPGTADNGQLLAEQEDKMPQELETLLASQQASIEQLAAQLQLAQAENQRLGSQVGSQGGELHTNRVNDRIRQLQGEGVPPAVLVEAHKLMLADYDPTGQSTGLNLSIDVAKSDGTTEQQEFGTVTDVVEHLLASVPRSEVNIAPVLDGVQVFHASQRQEETKTVEQKADDIERELHPERFDGDGNRVTNEKAA